jgi:hypothetical protein
MRVLCRIVRVVMALAVAALSASCTGHYYVHFSEEYRQSVFTDAARRKFSTFFFCPPDRIQITPSFGPPPPVEISIDPGRAAMWRDLNEGVRYYDLSGCGHDETVECKMGWRNSCSSISVNRARPDQHVAEPAIPLDQLLRDYAMDAGATD